MPLTLPLDLSSPRLAVLISGGGTTMVNLAQRIRDGRLDASIAVVIASREDAPGLRRAAELNLPAMAVGRAGYDSPEAFSKAVFQLARDAGADLVCLAGFLSLLTIPDDFAGRVINIHPALLPSFGGPGMYGRRVHEAVLAAGCRVSGCTVHLADQTYDTGPILVQRCCPVLDDDTPETLAARVFEEECEAYPEAIGMRVGSKTPSKTPTHSNASASPMVQRARALSEEAHAGQTRKGDQLPYATHPANVAQFLVEVGVTDAEVLAAAYLHDTVEDTDVTLDQLREGFSERVAHLVDQLTLDPEEERTFDHKHASLARHAREMEDDAKLIKLADRLSNLNDLHGRPPAKRGRYARATITLLAALLPWPAPGDELARKILARLPAHLEDR